MYGAPGEFAEDMALVWANARTYNEPGTDVYLMASTLQVACPDRRPLLWACATLKGSCPISRDRNGVWAKCWRTSSMAHSMSGRFLSWA